jgi:hypothetical protein
MVMFPAGIAVLAIELPSIVFPNMERISASAIS